MKNTETDKKRKIKLQDIASHLQPDENIIGHDKLQDSTLSEKSNKDAKGKKKGLFSRLFKWLK